MKMSMFTIMYSYIYILYIHDNNNNNNNIDNDNDEILNQNNDHIQFEVSLCNLFVVIVSCLVCLSWFMF